MVITKSLPYLPKFYDRYIKLVDEDNDLVSLLTETRSLYRDQLPKLEELGNRTYEDGKWNVKQIILHIIDNERIMSCRLMRLARREGVELPGYEQDILAANGKVDHRSLENLIDEFEICRDSTISLVKSLADEDLMSEGVCSGITLLACHLGFQMPGHQIHHQNVLEERYYSNFNIV